MQGYLKCWTAFILSLAENKPFKLFLANLWCELLCKGQLLLVEERR